MTIHFAVYGPRRVYGVPVATGEGGCKAVREVGRIKGVTKEQIATRIRPESCQKCDQSSAGNNLRTGGARRACEKLK